MNSFDKPEEVQQRRAMFAQFARLKANHDAKNQTTPVVESTTNSFNPWMSELEEAEYRSNQMSYSKAHKAEYEVVEESEEEREEDRDEEPELSDEQRAELESKAASAVIACLNKRSSARTLGVRNLRVGGAEFEQTSTILPPPTEYPTSEFNSNINTSDLRNEFFNHYQSQRSLPIYKSRRHIINSISSYSVTLIEGTTGCGKTTQVPIYILEDAILDRPTKKSPVIYVTQPRRIAARSIAERVCVEHNWEVGSLVGYQVGMDKVVGPKTVLVFCTAGVLLQKLIQDKSLKSYTHIIIDEAHERDSDTDLLVMMIRTLMRKEQLFFKLIVMSATMDSDKFKSYFIYKPSFGLGTATMPSSIIIEQDRKPNNIQIVYLDKLKSLFNVEEKEMPIFDLNEPDLHESCLRAAVEIIANVIPHMDTYNEYTSSTLVFLPGLAEIQKLDRMIRCLVGVEDNLDIIPLHSTLTVTDQIRVFQPSRPGCRKVILATNIAESSITVKDVGFIIDFCLTKTLMKDLVSRFPILKLQWATHDKCTQRTGRTGRCCQGRVFRMVPHNFYNSFLRFAEPELLTAPLELSVLKVKNFQMGELASLLAVVLDPPPLCEIRTAVLELKQIGALSSTYKGVTSDIDGDLTELGQVISALPIDVHLSKLIVVASVFDVLKDAITVAACLSTNRTVVKQWYGNVIESYNNKLNWSNGLFSDLFVSLDVYNQYDEFRNNKNKNPQWLNNWCRSGGLDERKLFDVEALIKELTTRLEQVNITVIDQPNRERDVDHDNLMLKIAFCAAFYPNYFLSRQLDASAVTRELCGLDPTRTVIMRNFPIGQVPIYRDQVLKQIKDVIGENSLDDVEFVADVSRAMLLMSDDSDCIRDESVQQALKDSNIIEPSPGIRRNILLALKMGEMGDYLQIREFKELPAVQRMEFYLNQKEAVSQALGSKLCPPWMKIVDGEPDNNRLVEADEDEYQQITKRNYYVEVQFNQDRSEADAHELYELEAFEKAECSMVEHHIYKPGTRVIRGPDSPIRMSFYSILEKSKGFNVDIDQHSVNSILLDPEYELDRRQMLVAVSVCKSKKGRLLARDTTLMPNIRGLPTIMSLLFSQYYRFVYNDQMNCLAGAIFGIGWYKDGQPIDRLYEAELGFDVHITPEDISLINTGRKKISELLEFTKIQNVGKPQAVLQQQLREIVMQLLRRRRYPINEIDLSSAIYNGGFTVDKPYVPSDQNMCLGSDDACPFLPIMEMSRNYKEIDLYDSIRQNLNLLNSIEAGESEMPSDGICCLLCGNGTTCYFMLFAKVCQHLYAGSHLQKLNEFRVFEECARYRYRASEECDQS